MPTPRLPPALVTAALCLLLSLLVLSPAPAQALPALQSTQPAEGGELASDGEYLLHFVRPLTQAEQRALRIALQGPAGAVEVSALPQGKTLRVRPAKELVPGMDYTLLLQDKASHHVLSFRTDAASKSAATAATAPPPEGPRFRPTVEHRRGHWRMGELPAHSRDARGQAAEQLQELDRLPAPAREKLLARLRASGEMRGDVQPDKRFMHRPHARAVDLPAAKPSAKANANATALATLSGQVLRVDGTPLAGVRLSLGPRSTRTDANGDFRLDKLSAGSQVLIIDGQARRQAGEGQVERERIDYGRYEYRVELESGSNELPHTIWLSAIDHANAVRLDVPTTRETRITHPDMPGLELVLPAGAVVRDAEGKLVREVSITPVATDRLPFPMPYGEVALFYTLQPGGAKIESVDGKPLGATLHYPNYSTQPAGARIDLFDYDPQGRGWYTYTQGRVSADGQRVEADVPFTLYRFALSSAASGGGPEGKKEPNCQDKDKTADPVICSSGVFVEAADDVQIADILPLTVDREYRTGDSNQRAFGVGTQTLHEDYLFFEGQSGYSASAVQLVTAGGIAVRFVPESGAANLDLRLPASIFVSREPGPWFGARFAITATGYGNDFAITRKDGSRYGFSYFQSRLKWLADRFGSRTTITRGGTSSRITRLVSPHGRWLEFAYGVTSCTNCIKTITDHTGRQVSYDYDTQGRLIKVTAPENTVTEYGGYDSAHRMGWVKDARGHTKVVNEYYTATGNAALDGRVKKQTYPDTTTFTFNYFFNPDNSIAATEATDERGTIRRREYNASRYIVRDVHAKGTADEAVWQYQRDANNLVTLETDPLGRQTKFDYDTAGNLLAKTVLFGTAEATTWSWTYEPKYHQLATATDPLLRTTTNSFDAQARLIETRNMLGHKISFDYHPSGQLATVTRFPDGSTPLATSFTYEWGDLVQVTDPLSRITRFNVDALGRVIGIRDAAGQLSTITYDDLDRPTERCNPANECAGMLYDKNSNLERFTLGSTRRDFSYDTRNRLLTEGRETQTEFTHAYEPGGQLKKLTEASGREHETTVFDALGRPKTTVIRQGGVPLRTITQQYDLAGRLLNVADSVAGSLAYTYDNRFDAVKTETGPSGSLTYDYYANGLRERTTPTGGTAISYQYDTANRLSTITQAAGTGSATPGTPQTIGFQYDQAGRRTKLTLANGITLDYGWDNADQLDTLTYKLGAGVLGDLDYDYDNLGRRTKLTGSFARANLPPAMDLPVGADGRTSSENGTLLQYDLNGRLTQDASFNYTWNELGQLTEVRNKSNNALRASYQYDPAGRRISKTLDGQTTKYLHDGANPIQLQNAAGTPTANLLAGGIDEWFANTSGGQTRHFLADALGSTLRLTDGAGAKLVDYTYDPYGGTTNDNPVQGNANPFQYTGRENDGNGLYFHRARYRKPGMGGQFLSQDPLGLGGGDNLYAYVEGNPLSYIDPKGLWGEPGGSSFGGGLSLPGDPPSGSGVLCGDDKPKPKCKVPAVPTKKALAAYLFCRLLGAGQETDGIPSTPDSQPQPHKPPYTEPARPRPDRPAGPPPKKK